MGYCQLSRFVRPLFGITEIDKSTLWIGMEKSHCHDVSDIQSVFALNHPALDRRVEDSDIDSLLARTRDYATKDLADAVG